MDKKILDSALPVLLAFFLGMMVGQCISRATKKVSDSRSAHAVEEDVLREHNGGISDSAARMADALERIANVMEKTK